MKRSSCTVYADAHAMHLSRPISRYAYDAAGAYQYIKIQHTNEDHPKEFQIPCFRGADP